MHDNIFELHPLIDLCLSFASSYSGVTFFKDNHEIGSSLSVVVTEELKL